ncbi:AmmeMemoRadiSam system protein B [candidate division NPL-UPA2 bacterium]|nr:AmmeMemoRadiSam system protein B [candidate division NPL-UPA2 bacterium]
MVAGQFYPASERSLREQIQGFIDEGVEREEAVGVVSPHAGYIYSGKVAGAVYSRIVPAETFILLGPNHTGRGKPFSIMTDGVWNTPLGPVEIDSDMAKGILSESRNLKADEKAHSYEHSLEVQLPFLQYLKRDFCFVPIILFPADLSIYREIGEAIARVIRFKKTKTMVIASSDMTHYEPQKSAEEKDKEAIKAILELNERKLWERVGDLDISMCGYAPVAATLVACKELGAKKTELIQYMTSGDISGDYSAVVGYAGIIIR